jgi:SAM-dependent methyltransferase
MKECSKSIPRRLSDSNFLTRYFSGCGIDIGGAPDPLCLYSELFPKIFSVRTWDLPDGDAQYMASITGQEYDFVHSSHCLEHMHDPAVALKNWFRILKPNGYLVVTVPDEDLYEQSKFPSTFNRDHKWTFTMYKHKSWSSKSINVIDLFVKLGEEADIVRLSLLDNTYRYSLPRYDQTLTPISECGIEIVVRKRTIEELANGSTKERTIQPLDREVKIHLNQYMDDVQTLKRNNVANQPFSNDKDI